MIYSPYASLEAEIYGKLTPPADVTNFNMVAQGDKAYLSWTPVSDLDVTIGGSYWIRHTSIISGVTWAGSTDVTKTVPGNTDNYLAPLLSGSYLIKALDSSGNESQNTAFIKSNVADLLSLNAVYNSNQNPLFGSNTADKGVNDSRNSNVFYDSSDSTIELDPTNVASGTHDAYYVTGVHEDDVVSSGTHDDARSTGTSNDILVSGTHDDNLATGTHDDARATGAHNAILNTGSTDYQAANFIDSASGDFDDRSGNFDDIIHVTNKLEDDNASFDSTWLNNLVRNTTDNTTATVSAVDSGTVLTLSSDIFDASGESYRLETKVNQLRDTSATFVAADVGRTVRNNTDGGTATISTINSSSLITLSSSLFQNDHGDTWELEAGPGYLRDTGASFTSALVGRTVRNTNDSTTATVSTYVSSTELTLSSGIFDNKNTHNYEVEAGPNKLYNTGGGFVSSNVGNLVRNTNDNTTTTVSAYVSANELTLSSGIFDNKNGHTYNVHNETGRVRDTGASFSSSDVGRTIRNNTDNTTATVSSLVSSTELALSSSIFDDQSGDIWEIEGGPNFLRDTGASFTSALVGRRVRNTNDSTTTTVASYVSSTELTLTTGIFDNKDGHTYELEPGYDRLYDPSATFTDEYIGKLVRNTTDNTTATVSSRASATELVLSSGIFDNQDGEGYRIEAPSGVLRDTGVTFTDADHRYKIVRNLDTAATSTIVSINAYNEVLLANDLFGQTDGANYRVEGDIPAVGYYYFTDKVIDLGALYTSRVTASISSLGVAVKDLFDITTGSFDAKSGKFDGSDISDTNAVLQIRFTQDDPSGTPTWSAWVPSLIGDYYARALEFRVKLISGDTSHNVQIDALSMSVDMPDTLKRNTGVISSSGTNNGTEVVVYAIPYKVIPTVGITLQDADTGDYWTISSSTTSGFTVTFYNSSNIAAQKTFNWISTGY